MKKIIIIACAFLMSLVACTKEDVSVDSNGRIHKVFTANTVETKTSLGDDGVTVKWAEGDEINVIARTTGNQYTFTIKDGDAGKTSAEFEGTIDVADAKETVFYAVYPNVNVTITKGTTVDEDVIVFAGSSVTGHRKYFNSKDDPILAVKDGFDSAFAPLTAVNSGSNLTFRHGAAFFKLKMGTTGVRTVALMSAGSARFNGRPNYNAKDGTTKNVEGASNYILAQPSSGNFEENGVYYIPVLTKQSAVSTLTIEYTLADGITRAYASTTSLNSVKLASGVVYDLKTPPVVFEPSITAADFSIDQDATGGNIAFEIEHPAADGVISIVETAGKTNPADFVLNSTPKTGYFEFSCDENGETDPRKFYVTLVYTYNGGASQVTKDVVITQAGAAIHKVWDFSSTAWVEELELKGTKNSDITSWVSTVDGLTWTSTAKSKWNTTTISGNTYTYIQAGGKGSETDRVFTYDAPIAGTLKVTVSNTGGSADETRMCTVKVGTGEPVSKAGGCPSTEMRELTFTVSSAATVKIYPTGNALRFYKITFDSE